MQYYVQFNHGCNHKSVIKIGRAKFESLSQHPAFVAVIARPISKMKMAILSYDKGCSSCAVRQQMRTG